MLPFISTASGSGAAPQRLGAAPRLRRPLAHSKDAWCEQFPFRVTKIGRPLFPRCMFAGRYFWEGSGCVRRGGKGLRFRNRFSVGWIPLTSGGPTVEVQGLDDH